jgi:VWFA-related protein
LSRPLALAFILACTTHGFAQSRALIKLDVVATDSKGAPVTDLRATDIQIRDDGGPRPLAFFRFAGSKRAIAPPGPDEFVNRPAPPATLILLDRWNERELTMASAWHDVSVAVGHLEDVDRVYIYFLANHGELVPVRPLPGAETDLRAPGPPTAAAMVAKLNEAVRSLLGLRDVANLEPTARPDLTLQALSIVSRLALIPEPKNLIWVTHGFPIQVFSVTQQWIDYTGPLMGLAQTAARAQVAIYTVDQSTQGAGADIAGLSRQTLELIAAQTGGRWYSSGRAADALAGVATDARGRYEVAYYPPAREDRPKDRKLRVESPRKGIHLLTRSGSTGAQATPDPDEYVDEIFTRQSHSPFEATDIALRVAVARKAAAIHLEIHVDAADIFFERRDDGFHGSLSIQFALYGDGVFQSAQPTIKRELVYSKEQYDNVVKDGIVIPGDVMIPNQIQQVRVMVFDRAIQGLGSVTVR